MSTARAVLTIGLVTIAAASYAVPAYLTVFQKTYTIPKGSALDKASCATCHTASVPKLNAYGNDLKKAMASLKSKKITADVLVKVEDLDSDKDGVKNIVEIKAGTLPGDPKSK